MDLSYQSLYSCLLSTRIRRINKYFSLWHFPSTVEDSIYSERIVTEDNLSFVLSTSQLCRYNCSYRQIVIADLDFQKMHFCDVPILSSFKQSTHAMDKWWIGS